ncbi:ABC transporter permease [Chloroflexota bacterium]
MKAPKMMTEVSREAWISAFSIAFLVALWETTVDLGWISSAFIYSPSEIVRATVDLLRSGELMEHVWITLARMFAGFFAGSALGLIIGLAMGWSKTIRAILDPVVSIIYPLPKIALLPIIMLLVGFGESPIVLIIGLGAFFPMVVNSVAGVAGIDRIYFDVAKNYGAGRWKTLTRVVLPGSLPMVFAGLRLALGISLLVTVVVELSIATEGLGAMLWLAWETFRIERVYVAIGVIAVLALLLNPILKLIERRLAPWAQET